MSTLCSQCKVWVKIRGFRRPSRVCENSFNTSFYHRFMKNILKSLTLFALAFAFNPAFGQDVLGQAYLRNPNSPIYESVVTVGITNDGANLDYSTFASDISNKNINIAMLEQLRRFEIERLLAPYSGLRVESIILNNRRIVMNPEKQSAQIFYYHPDPTLAQRLANLFSRQFIDYCRALNCQDLATELEKFERAKAILDAEINKLGQAVNRYYESQGSNSSVSEPPQAKQLSALMEQKDQLLKRMADVKQKIRETPAGVRILRSATNPRKPKNAK